MDYRELFKESNKEVEERFLLTRERIGEIAAGEKNGMKEQVHRYFKKTAQFLEKCASDFLCISSDNSTRSAEFIRRITSYEGGVITEILPA